MAFSIAAPEGDVAKGAVQVTGFTDSMVAALVVGRGATSSFPLCLLAMEASAQMEARGVTLELNWVPREANEEADALSNFVFGGFRDENRVAMDMTNLPFLVMPELLESSSVFFADVASAKKRRTEVLPMTAGRKEESLLMREP